MIIFYILIINNMRKITSEAVRAFYNGENYKKNNTRVTERNGISEMCLHYNLIAIYNHNNEELKISDAGWQTNVTKERLNGVLPRGMYVKQKNFQWLLCNEGSECIEFKEGNSLNGVIIF